VRITRYSNLTEAQFQGCITAFTDSLSGELNGAATYLRRLENQPKGAAFAYEMSLDQHRYGALVVADRWATIVDAFGADPGLDRYRAMLDATPGQVQTAENILGRANALIDAAEQYSPELIAACMMAYQSMRTTFAAETAAAEQIAALGPMLPEEFRQARRIFLDDLADR
jgi:hypothetical protein